MKKVFTIVVLFFAGYSIAAKTMMLEIVSSNRPAKVYDIRVAIAKYEPFICCKYGKFIGFLRLSIASSL